MREKLPIVFLSAMLFASSLLTQSVFAEGPAMAANYIALTDQAKGDPRILVMDYGQKDWNADNPAAVVWSWKPADSGIDPAQSGWELPTEAKLRNSSAWGGQWVAMSDSYGFMGVVSYPGKVKKWSVNAGKNSNVHGIELLPNGNVAAAASTGGWVRVYTASQGSSSAKYVQYDLPDAHNVLWDPQKNVLWALGGNRLVQLKIGGTAENPTLVPAATTILPTGSGHDIQAVYGDTNSLRISMGQLVYTYNKTTDSVKLFQEIVGVKSVNNQLTSGQVIETRPHTSCTQSSWCTDVIEFYFPNDIRNRIGAAVYRSRIWNPNYQ